ncbi:hypothetical protein PROFUN_00730 [Planoprotostelium fungivorum]|uniref:Mechanosensitive ion channel MscS domain-containing protein n=1 Tax=Planoprotostelium fungivorum TaxID=1890364 RepID=A0A2P6NU79_9EUKA|nr:hypothetical protein PROFUN_00730 [Planoprotostelium fungivorum]
MCNFVKLDSRFLGLLSLIAGLAARPALENLIASIIIAFVRPVRLGDWITIKGDSGAVEKINSTFIILSNLEENNIDCIQLQIGLYVEMLQLSLSIFQLFLCGVVQCANFKTLTFSNHKFLKECYPVYRLKNIPFWQSDRKTATSDVRVVHPKECDESLLSEGHQPTAGPEKKSTTTDNDDANSADGGKEADVTLKGNLSAVKSASVIIDAVIPEPLFEKSPHILSSCATDDSDLTLDLILLEEFEMLALFDQLLILMQMRSAPGQSGRNRCHPCMLIGNRVFTVVLRAIPFKSTIKAREYTDGQSTHKKSHYGIYSE